MVSQALQQNEGRSISPARDRLARVLMIVLGIASVGAFANAAYGFGATLPERINIEAWRMLAFLVFAGLFILLGLFPRRLPGIWEIAFFHKAAITIFVLFIVPTHIADAPLSDNTGNIILVDGSLAIVTLVSYVLAKGWRSWSLRA
ncbi:MAG TPA: hypothetical protein VGC36_04360 [Rhizomicrobium sp.]